MFNLVPGWLRNHYMAHESESLEQLAPKSVHVHHVHLGAFGTMATLSIIGGTGKPAIWGYTIFLTTPLVVTSPYNQYACWWFLPAWQTVVSNHQQPH